MKFIIVSFLLCIFHVFVWAESPFDSKTSGIVHVELPEHIPHHPTNKDPVEQWHHDGIRYPKKRNKKLEEVFS